MARVRPALNFAIVSAIACLLLLSTATLADWGPSTPLAGEGYYSYLSANNARVLAATPSGEVWAFWCDEIEGAKNIYYKIHDGSTWSPVIPFTTNPEDSEDPCVAVDAGGNIHVAWYDLRSGGPGIHYKKFDGIAWGPIHTIVGAAVGAEHPCVAADACGDVHVVWRQYEYGLWGIYYAVSDGVSWSPNAKITDASGYAASPALAVDDTCNLHLAWADYRDSDWEIYYKRHDISGWSPDQRLTNAASYSTAPTVTVDTYGRVHVFWQDMRDGYDAIYHKVYDGVSWGPDESAVDVMVSARSPSVTPGEDGALHLVWDDEPLGVGSREILYREFDGLAWGEARRLSYLASDSQDPFVALTPGGEIHVVWALDRKFPYPPPKFDIFWKVYDADFDASPVVTAITPSQATSYSSVEISDLAGENFCASAEVYLQKEGMEDIAAADVVVHSPNKITCDFLLGGVAIGPWDVVVRNFDDNRDTLVAGFEVLPGAWYEDVRLTDDPAISNTTLSNARCIAADGAGYLHVVFSDTRDEDATELYYKRFDGISWGPDERLTYAPEPSKFPAIAADGAGCLHVVWADARDGNWEIYYKKHDGIGWSADQRFTDALGSSQYPSIAVDSNDNICVTWQDDRDGPFVIYARIHDGSSWLADVRVDSSVFHSMTPAVAAAYDRFHIVWKDQAGTEHTLDYASGDAAGWEEMETLTAGEDLSTPSLFAEPDGKLHVSWHHDMGTYNGDYEVFYKHFDGLAWHPDERLTDCDLNSHTTTVVADGAGNVYVFWAERRDSNNEMYYDMFDGIEWKGNLRLTDAPLESKYPSAAVDGDGGVHLVWRDYRNSNYEIYYKKGDPASLASVSVEAGEEIRAGFMRIAPNPVSAGTSVLFQQHVGAAGSVSVYDVAGRLLWREHFPEQPRGLHRLTWNGADACGIRLAPGAYFMVVDVAGEKLSSKVIVLR